MEGAEAQVCLRPVSLNPACRASSTPLPPRPPDLISPDPTTRLPGWDAAPVLATLGRPPSPPKSPHFWRLAPPSSRDAGPRIPTTAASTFPPASARRVRNRGCRAIQNKGRPARGRPSGRLLAVGSGRDAGLYLNAGLNEIQAQRQCLAHEHVRIVALVERFLQLLQLPAGEVGAGAPPLAPRALLVWVPRVCGRAQDATWLRHCRSRIHPPR